MEPGEKPNDLTGLSFTNLHKTPDRIRTNALQSAMRKPVVPKDFVRSPLPPRRGADPGAPAGEAAPGAAPLLLPLSLIHI